MKNLTRFLQRARRGAQMALCWVVVAATALCGMPASGFALQDESRKELYGDVVNPLTIKVNDRDCTFVDIDDGKLEGRTTMYDNVSFYTAAVKKVLPNWASLAYNILGYGGGDDSGDFLYWDHAGKGFEKDFGKGHYIYLYDALSGGNGEHSDGADRSIQSGLTSAKSLNAVYERLTDDIADCIDHKLTGSDFRKYVPLDGLSQDKTEQDVIYATIACVDKLGGTYQYDFNGFGIAFYNFRVQQLNSENKLNCAPEDAPGYSFVDSKTEQQLVTSALNVGYEDASQSITLARGTEETVATTTSESASYSKGGSWGASVSLKESLGVPGTASEEIETSFSAEATMSQLWEAGKTEEHSITTTDNQSVTVNMTIPAHTQVNSKQTSSTTTLSEDYDQPVGVTFDVIIFNMNGECYDDNAAVQEFHTAGYDQRSFYTTFGDQSTDAVQNLYLRSVAHRGDDGYDTTAGNVTSWSHRTNNHMVRAIDWNSVLADREVPSRNGGAPRTCNVLNDMAATYPMSITGSNLSFESVTVDTQLGTPQPIKPISKILVSLQTDKTRRLTVGEEDPISSYRVRARDEDDVDYYGFVKSSGDWRVVDKKGKECKSDVIEIQTDPVTHEQVVVGKKAGTAYVKYFIPEDTYVDVNGHVSTNDEIDAAAYKYKVSDVAPEPFNGSIKLEGSAQTVVGMEENLNGIEGLTATVYDTTGKEVDRTCSWEAQELESKGISVATDGTMVISQPGTFHVRAFIDGVYSDWAEVVASPAPVDPMTTVVETPVAATAADDAATQDAPATESAPAGDAAVDASAEATADTTATADDASTIPTGLITVLTDICRYGADHGLIKATSKDELTEQEFDIIGILYMMADSQGLVPQDAEEAMATWAKDNYNDDERAAWKQHALSVMLEYGYIAPGTTTTAPTEAPADGA